MKIAIMSDIHLGDVDSLFESRNGNQIFQTTFNRIMSGPTSECIPCDVLILNGDILDFAISSFKNSCEVAKTFFQYIYGHDLAKLVLYIPGNHDKYIWDALQWDIRVMKRMQAFDLPEDFDAMNPAYIDYSDPDKIHFPLMTSHPVFDMKVDINDPTLGDTFIRKLVKDTDEKPFKLLVAYPMVYINTNPNPGARLFSKDIIMVTHGHMMELGAQLITELLRGYVIPDINVNCNDYTFKQLEQYNYLFTNIINTGSGQSGDVSQLIYKIEQMVRSDKPYIREKFRKQVKHLIDRVKVNIDKIAFSNPKPPQNLWDSIKNPFAACFNKTALDLCMDGLENKITQTDSLGKPSDLAQRIKEDPNAKRYFETFLNACKKVTTIDFAEHGYTIPPIPGHIIFGHTHKSITITAGLSSKVDYGNIPIAFYNTGAWLTIPNDAIIYTVEHNGILKDTIFI